MFVGLLGTVFKILVLSWIPGFFLVIFSIYGRFVKLKPNTDFYKALRQIGYMLILIALNWQNFDEMLWGMLADGEANVIFASVTSGFLYVLMIAQWIIFTRRLLRWYFKKHYDVKYLTAFSVWFVMLFGFFAFPEIIVTNKHDLIENCRYVKPCGAKFTDPMADSYQVCPCR